MDSKANIRAFKYYAFNTNNLEALAQPYLWFSKINDFNDPFEGVFNPKTKYDDPQKTFDQIKNILTLSGSKMSIQTSEMISQVRENYDAKSAIEFFCSTSSSNLIRVAESYNKTNGACCLISQHDVAPKFENEILMWSHYAQGMKGFRIELSFSELIDSLDSNIQTHEIKYSNTPPDIDVIQFMEKLISNNREASRDLLRLVTTKHSSWAYESEIRIYSERIGKHSYDSRAIKEIIVGERMPDGSKKLIKALADRVINAPVKMARINRRNYELEIVEL